MKKDINQNRRRVLAAGSSAAALAALGFPAVLRAQAGALKVGVILPLTGVVSFPGVATRKGTELAIKMLGEKGIKVAKPSAKLAGELAAIGKTIASEWAQKAGPEGEAILNAYTK